jgi:membrane-associated phospholipid phosphatase
MRSMLVPLTALLLGAAAAPRPAMAQAADPPTVRKPLFTPADLAAAGGFAILTLAITPADQKLANAVQDSIRQGRMLFQRTAAFVREVATPGSIIIGSTLYAVGRIGGNERMAELGLHGLEALAVGGGVTYLIKGTVGRARPYMGLDSPRSFGLWRGFGSEDYRSFPSGHTVMAFAAAAAVTHTTNDWWPKSTWYIGTAMYGGATLAGVSRMYNNKHWASDVVVGAAIGTFAGLKVIRYHETRPDNPIDRALLSVSLRADERGVSGYTFSLIPGASLAPLEPR